LEQEEITLTQYKLKVEQLRDRKIIVSENKFTSKSPMRVVPRLGLRYESREDDSWYRQDQKRVFRSVDIDDNRQPAAE